MMSDCLRLCIRAPSFLKQASSKERHLQGDLAPGAQGFLRTSGRSDLGDHPDSLSDLAEENVDRACRVASYTLGMLYESW